MHAKICCLLLSPYLFEDGLEMEQSSGLKELEIPSFPGIVQLSCMLRTCSIGLLTRVLELFPVLLLVCWMEFSQDLLVDPVLNLEILCIDKESTHFSLSE